MLGFCCTAALVNIVSEGRPTFKVPNAVSLTPPPSLKQHGFRRKQRAEDNNGSLLVPYCRFVRDAARLLSDEALTILDSGF